MIEKGSVIGIIGGGQLGRMTAEASAKLGYKTHIYCPDPDSPAFQVSDLHTIASYEDRDSLEKFADSVDVITFEFENIPFDTLKFLEEHANVRPNPKALHITQNRVREKSFVNDIGIKTADFAAVTSLSELEEGYKKIGEGKAIIKTCELGYDGKGQARIENASQIKEIWEGSDFSNAVIEKFVPFEKEVSAIVARGEDGKSLCFPVAENMHKDGILDTSKVPANISKELEEKAKEIATKMADEMDLIGLLAVEFFVTKEGELLVNEMAPRPHNSGHWSMDGCETSQFEQFVRAVCGLEFGPVGITNKVEMKNLIGFDVEKSQEFIGDKQAKLHIYGKKETRKGRKMGHINFIK